MKKMMERKGVVGASEKSPSPWHKREDPLDEYVDVICIYEDGTRTVSYKDGDQFMYESCFGNVVCWMHFPKLPEWAKELEE